MVIGKIPLSLNCIVILFLGAYSTTCPSSLHCVGLSNLLLCIFFAKIYSIDLPQGRSQQRIRPWSRVSLRRFDYNGAISVFFC